MDVDAMNVYVMQLNLTVNYGEPSALWLIFHIVAAAGKLHGHYNVAWTICLALLFSPTQPDKLHQVSSLMLGPSS